VITSQGHASLLDTHSLLAVLVFRTVVDSAERANALLHGGGQPYPVTWCSPYLSPWSAAGVKNRKRAATAMNKESSRSHTIFTLQMDIKQQEGLTRRAHLHLVDLAGSERQKDAKTEGATFKETTLINQSLTTLGRVISALVDISNGLT
jgi:hypothetical protein